MARSSFAWLLISFFVVLGLSVEVTAQTVRTGSIAGTVTDESGTAVPGVTVTVTSPVLQVPQLEQLTNSRGEYEIVDLQPGTYQIVFEITGFAKLIRQDIGLTTGFVARINAVLKVATLEESVTVSGQSPVIDVQTTRGGTTVSKDVLASIPNNRNYQDLMNLTPGMVTVVPPQAGVIGMKGEANGFKNYGLNGQERTSIEGIDMGLIRFRGHFPKGGYDVQNGIKQSRKTCAPTVHRGVHGRRRPAGLG